MAFRGLPPIGAVPLVMFGAARRLYPNRGHPTAERALFFTLGDCLHVNVSRAAEGEQQQTPSGRVGVPASEVCDGWCDLQCSCVLVAPHMRRILVENATW